MNNLSAKSASRGNAMLVLKLFLPSWNFFNDYATVTRLEFCTTCPGEVESGWRPLHPIHSTRSWWRLIFNLWGNLDLLEKSLIDRVATALRESSESARANFAPTDEGAMLERLTRTRLNELESQPAGTTFRFRLLLVEPAVASEILFESTAQPLLAPRR